MSASRIRVCILSQSCAPINLSEGATLHSQKSHDLWLATLWGRIYPPTGKER